MKKILATLAVVTLAAAGALATTPMAYAGIPVPTVAADGYHQATKPSTIVLTVADGKDRVINLHWSKWNDFAATGTGTRSTVVCVPNCAASKTVKTTPVTVTLDHSYHRHFTQIHVQGQTFPRK